MTRKDYVRFAAVINSLDCPYTGKRIKYGWNGAKFALAEKISDVFAADNPRFDRAKFLKACGVES